MNKDAPRLARPLKILPCVLLRGGLHRTRTLGKPDASAVVHRNSGTEPWKVPEGDRAPSSLRCAIWNAFFWDLALYNVPLIALRFQLLQSGPARIHYLIAAGALLLIKVGAAIWAQAPAPFVT